MQLNLFHHDVLPDDILSGLHLKQKLQDVELKIKVTPKASKARVGRIENEALKIYVTSPPEDNKANEAVIRFLSEVLNHPASQMKITHGHHHRLKTIVLENCQIERIKTYLKQQMTK
jgi:uncharacterized protein (TIGR00251 family)